MAKLLAIVVILVSVVVLEGCGSAQAVKPEDVTVGNTIPDFSVPSLDGKTINFPAQWDPKLGIHVT